MTKASHSFSQLFLTSVRLPCILALSVSVYLFYGSLTGEALAGCGALSGCGTVLHSRWSSFFGIPVTLPAVILYGVILTATFRLNSQAAQKVLLFSAGALTTASAWFIGLQLFLIRAICPFCMVAHACGLFAALAILFAFAFPAPNVPVDPMLKLPRPALRLAAIGIIPVLILATGQGLYRPKSYAVQSADKLTTRAAPRIIELHDGLFHIDLSDTPMLGSPQASNIVVHLFDYTCPHCRELHPILNEVARTMSNQIAFASLVVPLATNCNHVLKRRIDQHVTACDLAFAALTVWRTKPDKLHELEDWIFSTPKPPAPEAVTNRVRELVGSNVFNIPENAAWIKQHLARNIDLYATNYYRLRKQTLPELMIGTNLVSGTVRSEQLYQLLRQQYGLSLPSPTDH